MLDILLGWLGFGWKSTGRKRTRTVMVVSTYPMLGRPGMAYPMQVKEREYRCPKSGRRVWRTVW